MAVQRIVEAPVVEVSPRALARALAADEVVLIDVRDPVEFDQGHIAGATLVPVTRFDPKLLPDPGGRRYVFYCAGGVRSLRALARCRAAGLEAAHLAGGINAWKAAGLPVVRRRAV
jgi:rhodanese-related sulfurtransferase